MLEIKQRRAFRSDLIEAWIYVADNDIDAADRLIDRVKETMLMLARTPFVGRHREGLQSGLRSFPIAPHLLFYVVESDHIDCVRFVHGARDLSKVFKKDAGGGS